jgi:hypothetical protein
MQNIWKMRAEIEVEPGDLDLEPGYTKGFMNTVICGATEESIKESLSNYLNSFRWKLLSTEDAQIVEEESDKGEEIGEMFERARHNPDAIILGTFHAYKTPE